MDVLRDHLAKSLRGGQAFVSYEKALDGIRPELRCVRPGEALHSMYEELYHMAVAQEDLLYYAIEDVWDSPEWPGGFWPESGHVATEEEWEGTVEKFFGDLAKAVELVMDPRIDLLALVPGSTAYTYLREVMVIIEHNAYHLGKIMDIRKALGDWR